MAKLSEIAARYRFFGESDAHTVSPLYQEIGLGIADDPEVLRIIACLPVDKQQPNLVLTATRFVAGDCGGYAEFRDQLIKHESAILDTIRNRRTQTNEPARCAALYALLATLPQPIALIEVGASAGLCLLLDRYRYDLDGRIAGSPSAPLTITTRVEGPAPELGPVEITWRAGIDLNPVDLHDPDAVAWLEALIWPGEHDRLTRLRAALDIARADPPTIHSGDLNAVLPELASTAPAGATLVVCHSAVLTYLSPAGRARFVDTVTEIGARWVSQEAAAVLPWMALPEPPPTGKPAFVLALDGRAVAYTAPHGGWIRWLATA